MRIGVPRAKPYTLKCVYADDGDIWNIFWRATHSLSVIASATADRGRFDALSFYGLVF